MADKYLKLIAGVPTQVEGSTASAGVGDAGKLVALNAQGKLDETMMPTGIGADVAIIQASENLVAGDFVNVWSDAGAARVRKCDGSSAGKEAHGFVLAAVASGNLATVYFEGTNNQVSGQVPGPVYMSAAAAGAAASVAPVGAGQVVQRIGVATSASAINVECGQHYVL